MNHADSFPVWTIYDHPSDYPACFVARMFIMFDGKSTATAKVLTANTLTAVRREVMSAMPHLPDCIDRAANDDPVIVECWV